MIFKLATKLLGNVIFWIWFAKKRISYQSWCTFDFCM